MDITLTVLTIVKDRHAALLNLIKGLILNEYAGIELVIVHMNEETCALPETPFPVMSISLNSQEPLPLAKARNLAIKNARAEKCVFLDVDCIPAANFISQYQQSLQNSQALWSGQVRYLKSDFPVVVDASDLIQWSTEDPIRANLETLPYELFWSLNFGCSKSVFKKIGGFDENYEGYGAEDTDFSFMARNKGIELKIVNALAFHQPHAAYDPPLNHLVDIVQNATLFYQKWRQWPMEGWLRKFANMGYITWSEKHLSIIKASTQEDIDRYLK